MIELIRKTLFAHCETISRNSSGLSKGFLLRQALLCLAIVCFGTTMAQNVGINETGKNPDNSAMVDIESTTRGLLIPRLTKIQRNAIPGPAEGLLIYQTDDTVGFWYYNNFNWEPIFQNIEAGSGLVGGKIKGYGTIDMATTSVQTGTYGYRDSIPQFTVNQFGQLVFAKNIAISEKDSVIGNEIADTTNALNMINRWGSGTSSDPYKLGINRGNSPRDLWLWNGNTWILSPLPFERDSIIGNEISDTTLARGILFRTGSGSALDPYKIGITAGASTNDVWMWNGSTWESKPIVFPTENDGIIGNELTDTSGAYGMLTKSGTGTAALPYTIGVKPANAVGDVWMWDGLQWVTSPLIIPQERDSIVGNEVADTTNALGILNRFGGGSSTSPYQLGINPGNNVGEVWTWDGLKWAPETIIHPTIFIPLEKDSVIGNEIADTLNANGILNRFGSGTDSDPYKIGVVDGTQLGQYWRWNGSSWQAQTITFPVEKDSVIGNEISDTTSAMGVLTLFGSGTNSSPYKVGVTSGQTIGDVWMWDGTKWIPTQISHPAEVDGIIGNEVTDTINARGLLTKSGSGTAANPYKIGIAAGSAGGDVPMWNGTAWVPTQITHPSEVDGIIGNEVTDTITNGFLNISGGGTAASPKKLGMKPGIAFGDILVWNSTTWVPSPLTHNTLDNSYDEGGAGLGRTIIADNGPLEVSGTDGMLISGVLNSGIGIGTPGNGTRMFYNPRKAAFRAGGVTGTNWDVGNVGAYSIGLGHNTLASGSYSFASGRNSIANSSYAIAMGDSSCALNERSIALGDHSKALGANTTAIGDNAFAYGQNSVVIGKSSYAEKAFCGIFGHDSYADGQYSYIMGYQDTTKGDYSVAIGRKAYAEGLGSIAIGVEVRTNNPYSIAIGNNVFAIADRSVALGSYVSTNNKNGSFIFGDASTSTSGTIMKNSTLNEMMMRFDGGYKLYSQANLATGVYMAKSSGAWSSVSDRNMKENFGPVNGEDLLKALESVPVSTWTYKNAPSDIRYMGPMAQDFYQAFKLGGPDSLGIKTINIDGVNLAAIQALSKRTEKITDLEQKLTNSEEKIEAQDKEIDELRREIEEIKAILRKNNQE
jgi:hypothetical protein